MARTHDVAARNNAALPIADMLTFLPQPNYLPWPLPSLCKLTVIFWIEKPLKFLIFYTRSVIVRGANFQQCTLRLS
jgi:hypothetical protein